ncbi:hypothetical protein, partial [Moorena sp. SIO4G3]|uniref:hypothetical protein n=1 Tax=Moorena sp. SIO4G3 TaxID=2607821 RepID=UPI0025D0B84A
GLSPPSVKQLEIRVFPAIPLSHTPPISGGSYLERAALFFKVKQLRVSIPVVPRIFSLCPYLNDTLAL